MKKLKLIYQMWYYERLCFMESELTDQIGLARADKSESTVKELLAVRNKILIQRINTVRKINKLLPEL